MSINLHDTVRTAITSVFDDEELTVYRSKGQEANIGGMIRAVYEAGEPIRGNFQTWDEGTIVHRDMVEKNTIVKRLYVYSSNNLSTRPWGMFRPIARSGDLFKDHHGRYWRAVEVRDDYSEAGWVCLVVELQQTPLNIYIEPSEEEGEGDGGESDG